MCVIILHLNSARKLDIETNMGIGIYKSTSWALDLWKSLRQGGRETACWEPLEQEPHLNAASAGE